MQQAPTLQTDFDQIPDPGTAIPPSDRLGFLLKPIDSSEIKQAVKKCKRGKAHGPDELGNDWYRDHCDEITGLFERLFKLWIPECVLPSSFSEAHIHCIKKSISAASPLDYRPIALLNSDYKIFTRIFATRLRTAAQQRATSDLAMSRAIALLLDFAKAYDSLDRSFLVQALQHLGFPLKFVHLVKVLHSQTTYKFIANGFLSRKYNVTSGIRQGCPLAPLLFILALEVLYRKIEASDEIHGVELEAAGCATEVRLGGYADDTTIYLSDPKDINAVFAILDKYGAASGLRVNRHKSAVLPLNKEYSSTEESVSDIHVLQREEHCRYLGIQVGQTPSNASNWSKCIQALRVRLRLARLKTHSVAKRAAIASAVIIPKVLYVARHSWPSTAIVNQLHDLVKQFVSGSRNGKPAKPWMKEEQAELKKMNGGLSVPNIRTELMTMSATAVSRWAITTSHINQVIGEILLHNTRASSTYITPLDAIPRRPLQLRDNMWTTGAALCASLHSQPYEPRERDNVRWCYEHFKSTIVQTQWDGDVFQIDLSSKISDRLPGIIAEGRKLRGTFCAEWSPYMTSTADGWLLDSNGSPYKLAHTSLSVGTAQLGDILRWEWIRPGVLNFIPTCGISGFSWPSIRALERLCATLVSNFPQLLYRPQQTNVLRLYNGQRHYNHEWHLHTSEATLTHVDTTLVKATHTVHSAMDCDIMATRGLNGQKTLLRLKANRLSMWNYEKADLSCSNPERSQVVQSSVQHLFWECPKAKLVWNYFYALWTKIGITPGHDPAIWIFSLDLPHTPKHAWTTIKRHIIGHKFSNEHLQDHLYSVAHMLWRYMSASLIQAIWCAHLRRMDSDPIESTAEMAIMMTRLEAGMRNLTRLAEAQARDSDGHTVAAVLKAYVDCFLSQTDTIPLILNDTRGVYLLFFDGGSRGNPGPGGTGSIIVRVHKDSHTASLIWVASMAYSRKDTTNNFAEYWGLIHGLREAQRSHFEPLYVIGDSALIISQQRMHRSPRQHRLARLYQISRRLADCIDIRGWYHHYRAFNKMADSAANLAMDTRTSTQVHFPTQRAAFNNLTQDLDNDVMHWLMRSSEDPRHIYTPQLPLSNLASFRVVDFASRHLMALFAESYETRALREENQWLLQCLQTSEQSCKQYRSAIKQQHRRISALEADGQRALGKPERQWKTRLQQKEKELMQEYAAQRQSLLQIIQHQESVQVRLEEELDRLRSCRATSLPASTSSHAAMNDDEPKCHCCHATNSAPACSTDTFANSPEAPAPEAIQAARIQQKPGFRASTLQRLQRRNPVFFETRSRCPPAIPEEDEGHEQEESEEDATGRVVNTTASTLIATNSSTSTESCESIASKSVRRDLEEQNRVLQERLASQQTVLDRILDTKLHKAATSLPQQTLHVKTTDPVDQMIKLHAEPLPTSECILIRQQRRPPGNADTDRLAPLSPPAA
ncbi:reverse transcriptase, partial [Globisporangium splendens]